MALMVLCLVGLTFGWLSSILGRTEDARQVFSQIGLALLASLIAGLYANGLTAMGGISVTALAIACAAASLVLGLYHLVMRGRTDQTQS